MPLTDQRPVSFALARHLNQALWQIPIHANQQCCSIVDRDRQSEISRQGNGGVLRPEQSESQMISLHNQPETNAPLSDSARVAIAEGIQRDDPVANLEYLGMSLRTLNLLENSQYTITKLSQLVDRRKDELLAIPNVTPSVLREILFSLANYHKLDEAQQRLPPMTKPR